MYSFQPFTFQTQMQSASPFWCRYKTELLLTGLCRAQSPQTGQWYEPEHLIPVYGRVRGGGWWDEAHRERETERGNNREVCGRNNGVTYWWNSSLRTLETCLTPVWQQIVLQNISLSASRFPLSLCQVSTVYLYVAEPACEHSVVIHTFKTHL